MDRKEFRRRLARRVRDVRFEELQKLLELYGWELDNIRGSHHVFRRGDEELISIPLRRPRVLEVYVRRAIRMTEDEDDE